MAVNANNPPIPCNIYGEHSLARHRRLNQQTRQTNFERAVFS